MRPVLPRAFPLGLDAPSMLGLTGTWEGMGGVAGMQSDTVFAGRVPELYDGTLGPILFQPFAVLLAARLGPGEGEILEVAAGTGIVTEAMAASRPEARITATDLNQAMLDIAAAKPGLQGVTFAQADLRALPFETGRFDAVVCGFGMMFPADKIAAYRELRRVTRAGRRLLFTVWDRIEDNPLQHLAELGAGDIFPDDPPRFLSRTPYGYHDPARIEAELRAAGYGVIAIEALTPASGETTAQLAAVGGCQGTPLRGEIEARDPDKLGAATERAAARLAARFGPDRFRGPMRALLVTAS